MIDLNKPGLGILVNEHVETENLEAHRIFEIIWLRCLVSMRQLRLGS